MGVSHFLSSCTGKLRYLPENRELEIISPMDSVVGRLNLKENFQKLKKQLKELGHTLWRLAVLWHEFSDERPFLIFQISRATGIFWKGNTNPLLIKFQFDWEIQTHYMYSNVLKYPALYVCSPGVKILSKRCTYYIIK